TPLTRSIKAKAESATLLLRLEGYRDETRTLALVAGEEIDVSETLAERTKTGSIDLFVKPWANVYFKGKKIGEAPTQGLRLPYGTHELRLENPVSKKERIIRVEVPASKPYSFLLGD